MLEIRNVTKVYRSKTGEEVRALDNVSVSFPESGMVFILGKSGSGKSTLLNVMGGLDSTDSGEFVIMGKSSNDFVGSDFDAYRNTFIGFIFQEYNILDDFTVGANIGLALELQGKKATDEAVNGILAQVDLLDYAKRKPNELSGGQKQRVAIARALVKDPQIIMADEPTGALDSNTGKQIFDTLKELSKQKLVLIVSHDRDFAERYADRIIELADGKIIEDVTKHEHHAERLSDGMHRINDHILRIEQGYKLTAKDLDMINAYLAGNNGDILLSGDTRVNTELRSAAGISEDGGTTVFEKTTSEDHSIKAYNKDETSFIRSRLPMKNAVKMGSSSLKHKKFRLFMTILLSFLSFAMFGLADTAAAYNKIEAATQSVIDSRYEALAVSLGVRHTTTYNDGDVYTRYQEAGLNDADIAWLSQQTGLEFVPVYTGSYYAGEGGGISLSSMMTGYDSNPVYNARISGLAAITRDALPPSYTLMGDMPEDKGEIVISEFIVRQFNQYGFNNGTDSIAAGQVTAQALIGKTIHFNQVGHMGGMHDGSGYVLKIVGVLNTNFDYARYQNLLPVAEGEPEPETGFVDMLLAEEVVHARDYGYHALGIVTTEQLIAIAGSSSASVSIGEHMNSGPGSLSLYVMRKPENEGDNPETVMTFHRVAGNSALRSLSVMWIGDAKTELGEKEILISSDMAMQLIQGEQQFTNFDRASFVALVDGLYGSGTWAQTNPNDSYYNRFNSISGRDFAHLRTYFGTLLGLSIPANASESNLRDLATAMLGSVYDEGIEGTSKTRLWDLQDALFEIYAERDVYGHELWKNTELVSIMTGPDEGNWTYKQPSEWGTANEAQRIEWTIWYYKNYVLDGNIFEIVGDTDRQDIQAAAQRVFLAFADVFGEEAMSNLIFELREQNHEEQSNTTLETYEGMKIVGIFDSSKLQDPHGLVISNDVYNRYKTWQAEFAASSDYGYIEDAASHADGVWSYALATINPDTDTAAIELLAKLSFPNEGDDYEWGLKNGVMYMLTSFNEIIEVVSQVFLWVGLGFAVFSAFLLMNFIATSISYKKREIGILRAVGARSSDVFKIFFSEAAIIALINFVLATAVSSAAIIVLNSVMRGAGIMITLLNFGIRQVLLMLGVSLLVAVLASFLPVYKIAKKKPVDAIKDR
ncbi:MAG: ABC transporter ATP-binding protein/permease [Clostridia bacterium]|nr:ABC transporter ATP-binding protein/permease [Clostridia bacterium]